MTEHSENSEQAERPERPEAGSAVPVHDAASTATEHDDAATQDQREELAALLRDAEATQAWLEAEVAELRRRANHLNIDELPDDFSRMRGRWSQLREFIESIREEHARGKHD